MGAAREIMRAEKAMRGAPANKSKTPTSNKREGTKRSAVSANLPFGSSRFSSKGARLACEAAKLTAEDFKGVTPSGQQDRYTIEDVQSVIAAREARNAAPATPPAASEPSEGHQS